MSKRISMLMVLAVAMFVAVGNVQADPSAAIAKIGGNAGALWGKVKAAGKSVNALSDLNKLQIEVAKAKATGDRKALIGALVGLLRLEADILKTDSTDISAHMRPIKKNGDDTELYLRMEDMSSTLRKLRRSVRKSSANADSLENLIKLQVETIDSKEMTPENAGKRSGAAKDKFNRGYRMAMVEVTVEMLRMEQQIMDGDNSAAMKTLLGLLKQKDKGHEEYQDEGGL